MSQISIWPLCKTWLSTWWQNPCWQSQRSDVSCSWPPGLHTSQEDFVSLLFADPLQVIKVLRLMFGKVRLGIGSGLVLSKQIVNTCRTRLVLLALFVVALNPYSNEWANSNKLNIILKCYWHDLLLRYILLTVFSVLWKTLTCLQQQFVTLPHKGHVLTALHVTVYLCSRVLNGFTCYLIHFNSY